MLISDWFIFIWSRGLVPRIQTMFEWFEFVGQVAGTKFWPLRLDLWMEMGSSQEGTWSPGLVAGTSPFVGADLTSYLLFI